MLWTFAPGRSHAFHIALPIATLLLAASVAAPFARGLLSRAPTDLEALRSLAVLLPGLFVWAVVAGLHALEIHGLVVGNSTEHILGAAILTIGGIVFSLFIFGIFGRLRDELARGAQRLRSLHQLSMGVAHEPAHPRLLELIGSGARNLTQADRVELDMAPPRERHPVARPGDGHHDPDAMEREAAAGRGGARSLATTLISRDLAIGSITAFRDDGPPFDREDVLLLEMFAVAAAAGVENVERLEETQLLAMIEERERIARDLHDDLGQLLGFLTTKIQAARELLSRDRPDKANEELAGLENATRMLAAQVRDAILGLRTRLGPDRPLAAALEEYVADFGVQAGLAITFAGDDTAGSGLPGSAQYQLLRIAQEALSNVRRHARARSATVELREAAGSLLLEIRDDGVGFPLDPPPTGFGLKTMTERAASLDAHFRLDPVLGRGTTITVTMPVPS